MKRLMRYLAGMMLAGGMAGMGIAGDIDSPGSPSAGSGMYTFKQIYDYLSAGTVSPIAESFQEPIAGPGSTMYTTKQIYEAVATPFPQCDASAADVKTGKKFFCTQSGSWGVQTGTNSGGTLLKTGQTASYQTGDDGTYQKGAAFNYAWDSGTDTVKDNVTGLIWASSGVGAGGNFGTPLYWSSAIVWAEGLTFAGYSDWRLPNATELYSLMDLGIADAPYINRTFFQSLNFYATSTTSPLDATKGFNVVFNLADGAPLSTFSKTTVGHQQSVRVVRGGE